MYVSPYSKLEALNKSENLHETNRLSLMFPPVTTNSMLFRKAKSRLMRKSVDLDKNVTEMLQQEIERAWDLARLSDHLKELYRALLFSLPPNLCSAEIAKQVQELNSGTAPVILVLKAIDAREHSLKGLKDLNASIAGTQIKSQYLLLECAEMLHAFRLLSLKCLEAVVTWRQHVYSIQQLVLKSYLIGRMSALPFIWENINYLIKMKTDIDWLKTSNLCKYFDFENGFDPFMVRCSATSQLENKNRTGIVLEGNAVLLPMNRQLLKRIMDAEMVLAEETVCDSIKPPNFSLALSAPVSANVSLVTTPHKIEDHGYGSKRHSHEHDRLLKTEHEKRPRNYQTNPMTERGSRRQTAIELHKKGRKSISEEKTPRVRDFRDRMMELLAEEIYEDILEVLTEAVVNSAIMDKENDRCAEDYRAAMLEDTLFQMVKFIADLGAKEVIAEDLLRPIIEDWAFLREVVTQQVNDYESEVKQEEELKLKKLIHRMEQDYAKNLCGAVVETTVQYEVASIVAEEIAKYKAEINERAMSSILAGMLEGLVISSCKELARDEIRLAKKLKSEEAAVNDAVSSILLGEVLGSIEVDLTGIAEEILSLMKEEEDQRQQQARILPDVINEVFKGLVDSVVSEIDIDDLARILLQDLKAQDIEFNELSAAVYDTLVDELANLELLTGTAETSVASMIKKADKQLAKEKAELERSLQSRRTIEGTAEAVLKSLIEEFVKLPWVDKVAEVQLNEERRLAEIRVTYADNVISMEVPDDYVQIAFTPGIHSPNIYSLSSLSLFSLSNAASDLEEEVHVSFVYLADTKGKARLGLGNISYDAAYIYKIVKDYYEQLRDPILPTVLSYDDLLTAEARLQLPCWYWFTVNGRVGGLLLFSLDMTGDSRKVEVLHFSTIYLTHYSACLKYFCDWLWHSDPCEEIRVDLYSGESLPSEVKKAYVGLDFKWKTETDETFPNYLLHVMGLERPSGVKFGDDSFTSEMLDT